MNGIISGRVAPLCPMREEETVTESKTKYCLSPSSLPLPRLRSTLSVRERWNREKSLSLPRRVLCLANVLLATTSYSRISDRRIRSLTPIVRHVSFEKFLP